ncbi:sialate O-acetylesterase [Neolewinella antarctica]|uniref:Sialate O-acetylesterase n=1 Tax=Neolewinella antarctica TaxID=442734 RepID=A0ABX0X6F0_9BACT|nr:sialate O-acetylesterase [Neolewinella antarctica]NJC24650.1 sialate O-acetylesterase [Neolewinella antarctica]
MRCQLILLLTVTLCTGVRAQGLTFFESFTDHAVLQRAVAHPIWGWGKPGKTVSLTFRGVKQRTKADVNGRWEFKLPTQEAGGPHTLSVTSGRERTSVDDVYFGDVYLISGQSNMGWHLEQSDLTGERARAIGDPLIRELSLPHSHANEPKEHLTTTDGWRTGDAGTIGKFSGVGAYYAHYLRQEVDVPIGLLNSSWGGSRIEPWMSPAALGAETPDEVDELIAAVSSVGGPGMENFRKNFPGRELPSDDVGEEMGWLKADHDASAWPIMNLPTFWEAAGYPAIDGTFYFRKSFTLTTEQAVGGATVHLGAIDDGDFTYVNDQLVGSIPQGHLEKRVYVIEPGVLKAGDDIITIRVVDTGGGGGFSASPPEMYLETATGRVSLAGEYRYNIGSISVDHKPNQIPTILYNSMIAPLGNMPLAGVLWYQGESNASEGDNVKYAGQMRALIRQWREQFSNPGTLPFYWVQLANFKDAVATPDEPGWAVLRESQTQALAEPLTGMAVITDIGEADDIHPKNKWEVGRRLSLFALRDVYGKDVVADSPQLVTAEAKSDDPARVDLTFDHLDGGLRVVSDDRYGYVKGFTVLDGVGEWKFAQAVLVDGNKIAIFGAPGKSITRVRYNWANNPDGNLFSKHGLPVNGFDVEIR